MSESTTVLTSDIEHLIASMSGVSASKVVSDDEGRITEIHVLADTTKSPKQLVRDIQSCTMAAFGIPVDYKTISVAQIQRGSRAEPAAAPAPAAPRPAPRILCDDLSIRLQKESVEVVVTLALEDSRFEGRGQGPATSRGRMHAAASACIAAVHGYLGANGTILLLEVQKNRIAGLETMTTALCFTEQDRETILVGSSLIREDSGEAAAVVRSVLDGMNRILTRTPRI